MKIYKLLSAMLSLAAVVSITACHNGKSEFDDYENGTSVYFAYQYPVRTIVLGYDPVVDNSRDLEHKCAIYATMGGSYKGKKITLDIAVDESLCDNLYYEDGSPVEAMPSSYYTLLNDKIKYNGELWGYVEVQLHDEFFDDAKAVANTYVIPVVIKEQKGADRIITGTPADEDASPARTDAEAWEVLPKDYVLYCVKYINAWHSAYLRRGEDTITENGTTTTVVRHAASVEKDELVNVTTKNLTTAVFPVSLTLADKSTVSCDLLLEFNDDNECTITTETAGVTASGTGLYRRNGEKKSWGNKDRDGLYLDYTVDFGTVQLAAKDTLVMQSRGTNKIETFTPKYQE